MTTARMIRTAVALGVDLVVMLFVIARMGGAL